MPRIACGEIKLNFIEHGSGDNVVLAIHGNLGCAQWLEPVFPLLPDNLHIIAPDWRGCGQSDKPEPDADYANYRMEVHARDHLALLDQLGIERCHLYGHSTGGIIVSHLLAIAPERFGKVLMLDPVSPLGLQLHEEQIGILTAMKNSLDVAMAGMATAAPTLFEAASLATGQPLYAATASELQRAVFKQIIDNTRLLSDGIWFGTPHNLAKEWAEGTLAKRMPQMKNEHLILFGAQDSWIPREHLETMVQKLPNARLEIFPDIGHSMNLEQSARLAEIFTNYFAAAPQPF